MPEPVDVVVDISHGDRPRRADSYHRPTGRKESMIGHALRRSTQTISPHPDSASGPGPAALFGPGVGIRTVATMARPIDRTRSHVLWWAWPCPRSTPVDRASMTCQ